MCDQCVKPQQQQPSGSRRRRIWDLPHPCHCPVVGVCLPLNVLRQLVNKAVGGQTLADDYEIHVGAVAQCSQRNALSETLQRALEARYALTVRAFKAAKTPRELAQLWTAAVTRGDVSGALWAGLTHPRCDEVLQEVMLRDMHMLQHQAGAAVRVDVAKFNELVVAHRRLGTELAREQERHARVLAERVAEIGQLNTQAMQHRAVVIGKDAQIEQLNQQLAQLKVALPDHEKAARQQLRWEQMGARQGELEAQNARLRQQLAEARRVCNAPQLTAHAGALPGPAADGTAPRAAMVGGPLRCTPHLGHKTVLCVGGRNGNVANYRDVVEKAGGQFAHHDGGLEDSQGALDASLAAADLVICQTGCINHNAYWRVKDFCKRTGKPCVFVENPSTSSLARCLQQVAVADAH